MFIVKCINLSNNCCIVEFLNFFNQIMLNLEVIIKYILKKHIKNYFNDKILLTKYILNKHNIQELF